MGRSGIVTLGEVVAVPVLPSAVRLGDDIATGAVLTGGEPAVLARTGEISFDLIVSAEQAALIPADATVDVRLDDLIWPAVIEGRRVDDANTTVFELGAPGGGAVCGDDCDRLPADEEAALRATVKLVPVTSGPGLPVAAIQTDEAGATYVTTEGGVRESVTVLASGDGIAIVDGVANGTSVIVSGDSD